MEHFLLTWGYLALFAVNLISSMGLPIGSEVVIGYGGALASGQLTVVGHDHLSLALVIVVSTLGEVAGSIVGYGIGRFGGRPLVDRFGKYILLTHRDLDRAERWFDGRGESFVLFGRLIPLVRSFVSVAAGLGEMAFGKFLLFTLIGSAMWCAALASIGYSLGSSWSHVIHAFSYAGYVAAALIVVGIIGLIYHRLRVIRSERANHSLTRLSHMGAPSGVPAEVSPSRSARRR